MKTKITRLLIGALTFMPVSLYADPSTTNNCTNSAQGQGLQAVDSSADCTGNALTTGFGNIINDFFIVAGAVAVLIMVIGGIRYITSTGDAKRVQAAKDTILYAIMGLVVVILARAIVGFVIGEIKVTS